MYEYKTSGTCSQRILFDVVDGKVRNVQFIGGCIGNLRASPPSSRVWMWTPSLSASAASAAA